MKRTIYRGSVAALALTASFGLAACSSGDEGTDASSSDQNTTSESSPSQEESSPSEGSSSASGGSASASGVFGPACSAVPSSGPGSLDGMSTAPVATAASNNPVLSTLVKAVKQADLVDTLNSAPAITVFAPANSAFEQIPKKDLNALLKNKEKLTTVLTHHVVKGQKSPDQLSGDLKTLAGDTITVEGSGEDFTIDQTQTGSTASVVCGNVQTANATVYIVDQVLKPQAG